MAVSEQTDSLRVLGSDPVDYLIVPRAVACMIAGPILNLMCFCMGALPFIFCFKLLQKAIMHVYFRDPTAYF